MDQRRFSRARFANQGGDAFPAGDRVLEMAQRLPVLVRQEQVARVRGQIERPLPQTVETFVHQRATTFHARTATELAMAAVAVPTISHRLCFCFRLCSTPLITPGIMASTGSPTAVAPSSPGRKLGSRDSSPAAGP